MDGATINGQQIKVNEVSIYFLANTVCNSNVHSKTIRHAPVVMEVAAVVAVEDTVEDVVEEDMEVVVADMVDVVVVDMEVFILGISSSNIDVRRLESCRKILFCPKNARCFFFLQK